MKIEDILKLIQDAPLLETTSNNLKAWLEADFLPKWALETIASLLENKEWDELNNRFYKHLAFGTGGMRGRTAGEVSAPSEQDPQAGTKHPAIGTNCLNDINIIRATLGLFQYTKQYIEANKRNTTPKLVIAHDMRHFSRHFCLLAASAWTRLGGQALIFEGPRSTPQLSFSVRHLKATAGIVITASHNPPHDNGFKVYFEDGGQVVSPHAEGIIKEVNAVDLKSVPMYFDIKEEAIEQVPQSAEDAYSQALRDILLEPDLIKEQKPKIVFTPIHGVGQVTSMPMLEELGAELVQVPEQNVMDPDFGTVKSPNPENAEALEYAVRQAQATQADAVIATDPDADRMGVAVRNNEGSMTLLSGNITGALLAQYRVTRLKDKGIIPQEGSMNAAIISTFVTTPLQEAIAKKQGVKCIKALTGFKWIATKLHQYEQELLKNSPEIQDYDALDQSQRTQELLKNSTYFIFGTEESYGYLAGDTIRDKDGNGATLMFTELVAHLKAQEKTVLDYLDEMYLEYGYYHEELCNLYYEGASGSAKIQKILTSYSEHPPKEFLGAKVTHSTDFIKDDLTDADGRPIAKEKFFFLELDNGYRYAVRGSGTEPKIKFYLFAHTPVNSAKELAAVKEQTREDINRFRKAIEADARARAQG